MQFFLLASTGFFHRCVCFQFFVPLQFCDLDVCTLLWTSYSAHSGNGSWRWHQHDRTVWCRLLQCLFGFRQGARIRQERSYWFSENTNLKHDQQIHHNIDFQQNRALSQYSLCTAAWISCHQVVFVLAFRCESSANTMMTSNTSGKLALVQGI